MKKNKTRYSFVEIWVSILFFSLITNGVYAGTPADSVDTLIAKYTLREVESVTKSEFQHLIDLSYDYSDTMQFEACDKLLSFLFLFTQKD